MRRFNEWLAGRITSGVSTMACAYLFAAISLIALPQAIRESLESGPLPVVTWLSQSFLQLVLLAVIMVGQDLQSRKSRKMAADDHNALREILTSLHAKHDALHVKHDTMMNSIERGNRHG